MAAKLAIPDMASTPTPATPGTARSTAPLMGKEQGVEVAESRCQWAMSRFIVARPLAVFFGTSFIIFVLSAIVGATGLMTFSEPSQHDWTIADAIESERLDAWTNAVSQTDNTGGSTEVDPRSESTQSLFLLATWKDGRDVDILTPSLVQHMCELENFFFKSSGYEDVCLLDYAASVGASNDRPCSTSHPVSLTAFFYGANASYTPGDCPVLSAAAVDAKAQALYAMMNDAVGARMAGFFMSAKFGAAHLFTERTRSRLSLGGPLKGFKSLTDREDDQREIYRQFYDRVEQRLWERFGFANTFFTSAYEAEAVEGDYQFKWFAPEFQNMEFNRIVNSDLAWTVASITFVFAYITMHVGSPFLSTISLLQIILSLPTSFFIYRIIFQIPFFTQLHVLAIFLVLGIGADDVFVFVDAWKQSADLPPDVSGSHLTRMVYAYSRTVSAVFNTSFTTAMAFISTAISPIMPISSFGIFAALAVVLNYVFAITLTPSLVLVWEIHIRGRSCLPGSCGKRADSSAQDAAGRRVDAAPTPSAAADGEADKSGAESKADRAVSPSPRVPPSPIDSNSVIVQPGKQARKGRAAEYFFEHVWARLLLKEVKLGRFVVRPVSLLIVLTLGSYAIFCATQAAQLRPPSEQEEWFSDSHMFTGIGDELSGAYKAGSDDSYRKIVVVFGIDGINRGDYNRYVPGKNRGSADFASTNLASAAFQTAFAEACDAVATEPCAVGGCLNGKLMLPGTTVRCPVNAFYAWVGGNAQPGNLTGEAYVAKLTEFRDSAAGSEYVDSIGLVGGQLKFMTFTFTSSMQMMQPSSIGREVYDVVEKFLKDKVAAKPVYQVADREWTWMVTQDALVNNMFTGLAICFPVAFVVLMFATGNIILAFYAVASIAFIVCIVLGMAEFVFGWALGIAESIAAVIVVGFSVDYVVHLSHMYIECEEDDRASRTTHALGRMGVTVLAGGLTTVGAGAFMLACSMTFFTKMAVLMVTTITSSLLFSLGFFMSLCALIGPEGTTGDIHHYARSLFGRKGSEGGAQPRAAARKIELNTKGDEKEEV